MFWHMEAGWLAERSPCNRSKWLRGAPWPIYVRMTFWLKVHRWFKIHLLPVIPTLSQCIAHKLLLPQPLGGCYLHYVDYCCRLPSPALCTIVWPSWAMPGRRRLRVAIFLMSLQEGLLPTCITHCGLLVVRINLLTCFPIKRPVFI